MKGTFAVGRPPVAEPPPSPTQVDLSSLCFEGTTPFDSSAVCDSPVPPLIVLSHADGFCSVIGGVV
jgi:hypothetical protein